MSLTFRHISAHTIFVYYGERQVAMMTCGTLVVYSNISDEVFQLLLCRYNLEPYGYTLKMSEEVNPNLHPVDGAGRPLLFVDGTYKHVNIPGVYTSMYITDKHIGGKLVIINSCTDKYTELYNIVGADVLVVTTGINSVKVDQNGVSPIHYGDIRKLRIKVFRDHLKSCVKRAIN